MLFDKLHFTRSLTVYICSVNFMLFCYCTTLGKIEGSLRDVQCKTNEDCMPNAYCLDNMYCKCLQNFVQEMSTHTCLPIGKNINDSCYIDLQCTSSFGTHAFCYKNVSKELGQCRCAKNTHFQDGLCYQSARLGESCKVSDNCVSASNVATYCAYSKCVCAANYHPTDDLLDCLPDVRLGMKCNSDEECVADHSYCSGVCRCQIGYINSEDNTKCLLAAKQLRAVCSEDSQCVEYLSNSFCDRQDNSCKCVPFSHELDKSCWISARLGERCSHPNQCTTASLNRSGVVCSHGICSCMDGYSRVHSDCLKVQDFKAESSTLEKCTFLITAAVLLSLPND